MKNLNTSKKAKSASKFAILVVCYILFMTSNSVLAQVPVFNWVSKIEGAGAEFSRKIAIDASGNTFELISIIGTSAVDCDPGPGVCSFTGLGSFDTFIIKLGNSGNFLWAKHIAGIYNERGISLATDNAGNVYITGTFSGTPDFDPGPGVYNVTSSSADGNMFVLKLDAAGNFVWVIKSDNTGTTEGVDISIESSGNILVAGNFLTTTDLEPGPGVFNLTSNGLSDIFIAKYTPAGNLIWAKQIGGGSDDRINTAYDHGSGYIYLAGYFQLTTDFDPGAGTFLLTSKGYTDNFVVKLDGSGNLVWAKATGNFNYDGNSYLTVDAAGNVYSTGSFRDTVDFDPGTGTNFLYATGTGNVDTYIQKLDAAGNLVWVKQIGANNGSNEYPNCISIDGSGKIYIAGLFYGIADFDPGAGVTSFTAAGSSDMYLFSLDPSGNFIFANAIGGSSHDQVTSIAIGSAGTVTLTGQFVGTVDFDPGASVNNISSIGANYDAFVLRLAAPTTLPVSLLDFNADYDGQHVNMHWSTATEKNNDYFTIEKSQNGIDFEVLNTVNGAGTSAVKLNYFSVDANPETGTTYYRLKQTDFNGDQVILKTEAVTIGNKKDDLLSAYSTVQQKKLFVTFQTGGSVTGNISLYDGLGRLIKHENIQTLPGRNTIEINENKLMTGIYYVHIMIGEKVIVNKIIM